MVSTNLISLSADKRPVKIQRNAKGLGFAVVSDGPVIVTSVEGGGPAAAGGLLKGDMILVVNGKEVRIWHSHAHFIHCQHYLSMTCGITF